MIVSMSSERVGIRMLCLFVIIIQVSTFVRSLFSLGSQKRVLDFEFPLVRPTALSVPRFDRGSVIR